jgi:immunoglobulin-binding protein 1
MSDEVAVPASGSDQNKPQGMLELFEKGVSLIESAPVESVSILTALQHDVAARSLFSSNESLDDISSRALSLLTLEHYLAMAYCRLPVKPAEIANRKGHLQLACDLWASFLHRLENLELMTVEEQQQYQDLQELTDGDLSKTPLPAANRDAKIARHRAKQQAAQERERLQSLMARRGRLGVAAEDEMDGHDEESLERTAALATVQMTKSEALEEWSGALRELPMIAMMCKAQQDRQGQEKYTGKSTDDRAPPDERVLSNQPLKLTHITQNSVTGQLHIRKEEIQSQVFKAGWNQPTMSLEELGDKEMKEAMERDARQKESEAGRMNEPRRYEQLVKDGMEDDADLVDASAALDRNWDQFKDENPRGMGNKRGDVGDRNF